MKFVVYEVWTRARVVKAESEDDAYREGEPAPSVGMSLCNWHVVSLEKDPEPPASGALNFRQVK